MSDVTDGEAAELIGTLKYPRKNKRRRAKKQDTSAHLGQLHGRIPIGQCPGSCCADFTIGGSTHEDVAKSKQDRQTHMRFSLDDKDGLYVIDMLIPVSKEEHNERIDRFFPLHVHERLKIPEDGNESNTHFTCAHWDETTRRCMAYASRPEMCSEYPYARECSHGCNFAYVFQAHTSPRGRRNLAGLAFQAANSRPALS